MAMSPSQGIYRGHVSSAVPRSMCAKLTSVALILLELAALNAP